MKFSKAKVFSSMIAMSNTALGMSMAMAATFPSKVVTAVNGILGAVTAVGVIVAAGMILYAGFKFLTAGAGEKAKAKDMLVPMCVGAILVAFAGPIANWAWQVIGATPGVTLDE